MSIQRAHLCFGIIVVLAAGAFTLLRAESPATQPVSQRITLYAAIVKPGPAWLDAEKAGRKLDMSRHFAYVAQMRAEGKLILGGPFADGTGGLIVYRAASIEEAQSMVSGDPAVMEKVFDPEVHPWSVQAGDLAASRR